MPWSILPLASLALDLLFKDPRIWPHPTRFLGFILDKLELPARSLGIPLRLAGGLCVLLLSAIVWFLVAVLTSLPVIGWALALYFGYAGLALGGLLQEGGRAAMRLRQGDLEQARAVLSGLVSRDVDQLDEDGLRRALAETVSENFNDAFVAPFTYLLLLGPVGLWVYKTVSTMDSMWGYTIERWKDLGWAAARADDLLAYVPARLSACCIFLCAWIMRFPNMPRWNTIARHAVKTESPNAGWPMAAAAFVLQAGMGGPTTYHGNVKQKPWLGPGDQAWDNDRITSLLKLIRHTGVAFGVFTSVIYFFLMHYFA